MSCFWYINFANLFSLVIDLTDYLSRQLLKDLAQVVSNLPLITLIHQDPVHLLSVVVLPLKMQFFKLFVATLLPLATMASAAASPAGSALGDSTVLSAAERSYVEALLLKRAGMPSQTTSGIEARQTDLTSALDQLLSLVSELGQFLNADFLNDTHSVVVNLADLLADPFVPDTRGIINDASGLLSSLSPLISQLSNIDIGGIISAIQPLLTSDAISGIGTLLTNAENLLTANFVSEVTGLINDVAPVSLPPRTALVLEFFD